MKTKTHIIFIVVYLLILSTPILLVFTGIKLEPRYETEKNKLKF